MKNMRLSVISAVATTLIVANTCVMAADPVTLTITGNVTANPCSVKSDSVNKTIDLGQGQDIQASTLQAIGAATPWINFDLNLENCPAGTNVVKMTMHGTADTASTGDLYKNTGTATRLAVQLQSQAGDQLGDSKTLSGNIASNSYTYKLRTRALASTGGATSGSISSVVTATFEYQ